MTLRALEALASDPPPEDDEDSLNWALAAHLRHAIFEARRVGEVSLEPPALEPKSMAVGAVSQGLQPRDRKRPDLTWQWCDDHAPLDDQPFLEMAIECKRLGPGDWCRLYVVNGVLRFQNEEHAYGKLMRSGFMVGYLQGISVADAEQAVSGALTGSGLAALGDPVHPGTTFCHELSRPYPVDPFTLHHMWRAITTSASP